MKNIKRITSALLALVMLMTIITSVNFKSYALENSGSCGVYVNYSFDESTGTLTISGSEGIYDYEEDSPFEGCEEIKSIIINEGVTRIGSEAFFGCTKVTNVTLPNSLKSIDVYAFYGCSSLTSITIPNGVYRISGYAFSDCANLENINVPNSVTRIDRGAFDNTAFYNDTNNWVDDTLYLGNHLIKAKNTITGSFDVKEGTICIAQNAFYNCSSITSVSLPDSIKGIGAYAFEGCSGMSSISIPKGIEDILDGTFYNCSGLTSITIPYGVNVIGSYAFFGCSNLASITIPETVICISNYVFNNCDKLSTVNYNGTSENFDKIDIGTYGNTSFTNAEKTYHTHAYSNDPEIKDATCTEDGYKKYTCDSCDKEYEETITKKGHSFTNYTKTTPATCTTNEIQTAKCDRCDQIDTKEVYYSCLGHTAYKDLDSVTIIVKPTCASLGECTWNCERCGEPQYDLIVKDRNNHNLKTVTKTATMSADGSITTKCNDCGEVIKSASIKKIASVKLSASSYIYDGKVKTPSVVVKDSAGKTLVKNTDYTVSYSKERKNVGKYTAKVTFKGKYSGTKSLSFVINPKGTSISSLTALKAGFKATLKKQATQTTGYQIQYSTSSKMTSSKTVNITKNTTLSKAVSKLSKKKKYYVRVRTYKTVSGTKYYSSWSGVKSVTTK